MCGTSTHIAPSRLVLASFTSLHRTDLVVDRISGFVLTAHTGERVPY